MRHHGWRDLPSRAFIPRHDHFVRYEERMAFNGRSYPSETNIDMMNPLPGPVVIRADDRGHPLFQAAPEGSAAKS